MTIDEIVGLVAKELDDSPEKIRKQLHDYFVENPDEYLEFCDLVDTVVGQIRSVRTVH